MVFMLFSGAYLFQVGLVGLQVREFKSLLGGMLLYALVYAAYAAVKLVRCSVVAFAIVFARVFACSPPPLTDAPTPPFCRCRATLAPRARQRHTCGACQASSLFLCYKSCAP